MLGQGYIPYHPALDAGIDVVYLREADSDLRLVQLKARPTTDKKYRDRDIWIACPDWYLYPHDELVEFAVGKHIDLSLIHI